MDLNLDLMCVLDDTTGWITENNGVLEYHFDELSEMNPISADIEMELLRAGGYAHLDGWILMLISVDYEEKETIFTFCKVTKVEEL